MNVDAPMTSLARLRPHRHERHDQDIRHVMNGAFMAVGVLIAPFMASGMSRTRLSRRVVRVEGRAR
jgi:hypothetical protein